MFFKRDQSMLNERVYLKVERKQPQSHSKKNFSLSYNYLQHMYMYTGLTITIK